MKRRVWVLLFFAAWFQAAVSAEAVQMPKFADWQERQARETADTDGPEEGRPDVQGVRIVEEKRGGRQYKKLVYSEEAYLKLKQEVVVARQDYADLEERRKAEGDQALIEKADLFRELGVAYSEAGRYKEAIRMLEQSVALAKDRPEPYYYLGLLYRYQDRDFKRAEDALKHYLQLRPKAENRQAVENLIEAIRSEGAE